MTSFGDTLYKIRSTDPNDLVSECNRVFELLSDRLDKIEGFRGEPTLNATQTTNYDIVVTSTNRGLVLKDGDVDPPVYYRVTAESGALVLTSLGRDYT